MSQFQIDYLEKIPATSGIHNYAGNAAPLAPSPLVRLPSGKCRPGGWLMRALERMRDGLAGHLCETSVFMTPSNGWIQPERMETDVRRMNDTLAPGEDRVRRQTKPGYNEIAWEEQVYWLRGARQLAVLLDDPRLLKLTGEYIRSILDSAQADGWFGPQCLRYPLGRDSKEKIVDVWPHIIVMDALQSYYEETQDERVIEVLNRFFRFCEDPENGCLISKDMPELGDLWQPVIQNTRACDILPHLAWLYNRTGEPYLLKLAERIYRTFAPPESGKYCSMHGVDFAQRFSYPAAHYVFSSNAAELERAERLYQNFVDEFGQLPGGALAADEMAREGKTDPRQGFETCAMVELDRSFGRIGEMTGDPVYADRSENVMLNSYPASHTSDMRAIHYLTAVNMPEIDERPRDYHNGGCQTPYVEKGIYRCCVHNGSMGWPGYAQRMILAADGDGAAVWLYGSCEAEVRVADRRTARIQIETDYPFDTRVSISVRCDQSAEFPLYLRVPGWCERVELCVHGEKTVFSGKERIIRIQGTWYDENVELTFQQRIQTTRWTKNGNCISVSRGPLTYSLYIAEEWYEKQFWRFSARCARPKTPWNYALRTDEKAAIVPGEETFQDSRPWDSENPPICLYARGKRLPGWHINAENHTVSPVPESPVESEEEEVSLKLIPMGCARLRICCFPTLKEETDISLSGAETLSGRKE